MGGDLPAGTARCDTCGWTTKGVRRFHEAVEHREQTGHESVPASLRDEPGDDTGRRVREALTRANWEMRR